MQFASADPSVGKSIRQRYFLNEWLRAQPRYRHADRRLLQEHRHRRRFKINNLMGLSPKAEPVILVRAIIDRAFVPTSANAHSTDEIVELD
jgi:hypothetical protein